MLRIKIADIGLEGLDLNIEVPAKELDFVEEKSVRFTEPFKITARLEKLREKVSVNGELKGVYAGECGRCLEMVKGEWSRNFSFVLEIDRTTEFIDITDQLREEVLLYLPQKVLCREGCLGICSKCGQNLNERDCGCDRGEYHNHVESDQEKYQPFKNLKLK